ncbi:hypothetical protein [Dyella sp. RRB7]|uniref:hypothetical protein n=1 Tax=Dyella sp. RRB7 TaxID=2919502 RepID=UPI001FAAC170|nr:hypothetical protein [Dyella sp. RRB7]
MRREPGFGQGGQKPKDAMGAQLRSTSPWSTIAKVLAFSAPPSTRLPQGLLMRVFHAILAGISRSGYL